MEVTYYEDPACGWCWAFQPVATAFFFEFRHMIRIRHVMGGLRNRPATDRTFAMQQWKKAEALFGMPFEPRVWTRHNIDTTFTACRAVKAAAIIDEGGASRLLRRLREAYFTEEAAIDDIEVILRLAMEVGFDSDSLRENLASGRAEELFARDRAEADAAGFGYPTIGILSKKQEAPVILQGTVDYGVILETLFSLGVAQRRRRRFKGAREDWEALFGIHRRLTSQEIRQVTGIGEEDLNGRLGELGLRRSGFFYEWMNGAKREAPRCSACTPVSLIDGESAGEAELLEATESAAGELTEGG